MRRTILMVLLLALVAGCHVKLSGEAAMMGKWNAPDQPITAPAAEKK